MDNKLFYQDSYIKTFSSNVVKQEKDESGNWYMILDKTAFYPTGGGQPFDTGTLNEIQVLNVEEINNEIRHYLESPLPNGDDKIVVGHIDWERRFDHMQQHAGQHILSAAFEELFGLPTISFHLGQEIVTIDIETDQVSEEQLRAVENRANQIIIENLPIETKWITEGELINYPLRKIPTVTENIRLVIIPDFDYNGCGGTHPTSTGQVSAIKILGYERQRKKIRIQFVCGKRVLKMLHEKQDVLNELTILLNSPEQEMVASLKRILNQAKSTEKILEEAHQRIIEFEAKEFFEEANNLVAYKVVGKVLHNRSIKELQMLARAILNLSQKIVVILVSENESQIQFVATRGASIELNMKALISDLLPSINGKGGGNESSAQGGGTNLISGQELLERGLKQIN